MPWIYLSPHFDDVAFSCGGLVWEQAQAREAPSIWTVCAGKPPTGELSPFAQSLHARWQAQQDATEVRRAEDLASCRRLGADSYHLRIPDCIYRREPHTGEFLYPSEESLNGPLHPGDMGNLLSLQSELRPLLTEEMVVVGPLGIGNHVDHQLTHLSLEGLGCSSWYYPDVPYALRLDKQDAYAEQLEAEGWISCIFSVSEPGLVAWQDSIAAHASQISTFWSGEAEMRQAIADYFHKWQGVRLWRRLSAQ